MRELRHTLLILGTMERSMERRSLRRFRRRLSAMRFFDGVPLPALSLLSGWVPEAGMLLIPELSPAPPPNTNVDELAIGSLRGRVSGALPAAAWTTAGGSGMQLLQGLHTSLR